ncbi:MAG: flavin reductase, partial [Anaerolineae bacterium CG_4_9_14_0_8_um_filter_58_9]
VAHLNHFYPAVAAVVTVRSGERMNAMACAWHSALSFTPPLYGVLISSKRFSYQLIIDAGAFGVNFLPYEKAELIARVGRNSGRDVDKFTTFSIAIEPLPDALAPILKDAYAAYECRLAARHPCGDHELFVGEIVRVHHAPETFTEDGVLDVSRVRPALYLGADWYIYPTGEPPRLLRGALPH